jgi:L-alanine-DL-glutamate epimerase-like enolase superfamily enzyme
MLGEPEKSGLRRPCRDTGTRVGSPALGRREFLRVLGASVGAAGIMGPFEFARAASEPGIYITDIYRTQLDVGGVIVRIDTNKGISGYGECRDVDPNSVAELSALKPLIMGMNPTHVDKVLGAIRNYNNPQADWLRQEEHTGAMCGIEVACWDITGQVQNVPIWKLIGPKLRDQIRLYCDTDQKTAATLPSFVQKRLDMGFTWFKTDMYLSSLASGHYTVGATKNGYGYYPITIDDTGLENLRQYARAFRSLIGTYPLSTDHYQGYNNFANQLDVSAAVQLANAMAASDCQGLYGGWMEDIIDWGWKDANGVPALKQVRDQVHAQSGMPILTGEDMYSLDQYKALVDAGAVDIIHPDQATAGGIHQPRLAGLYASAKGIHTALHCSGGPFSYLASLHVAAGIPDFLAMEYHHIDEAPNSWFDSVVDGIEKPLINHGFAAVPNGPGLGITPNAAAMSAHGASTWTRVT